MNEEINVNNAKDKLCGCKGIRSCLLCENVDTATKLTESKPLKIYEYCQQCRSAWEYGHHPDHGGSSIEFPGIYLQEEFVTEEQERDLCKNIDSTPFVDSQSGRRKQDYGPKVNFKKKKVKCDVFTGLPDYSQPLYKQLTSILGMADFIPVELCNLEYVPERGSAIDPHFDDFWLWGERLVTINLLSDTILCFTHTEKPDLEIHVKLKRRSLVSVEAAARHDWKHAIHRNDIKSRRIAMTFRELSAEFDDDGTNGSIGRKLKDIALTFKGTAVGMKPEL
ncbi:hypothetical protein SNE40_006769 [Patella caerulea]|uniref:Uncharacterized protein n=1 Tax=Patella caerulea TaxID=87958 RepID=A0AAN8K3B9_PATCE